MTRLWLVPQRGVPDLVLRAVASACEADLQLEVVRTEALEVPKAAYDSARRQYSGPALLEWLDRAEPSASLLLGVVSVDLFIPMLSYIFGQAQLDGRLAIVSLARLQQSFYGLPDDPPLLEQRAVKEALHELGHVVGLRHCASVRCAMSLSTTLAQVDHKRAAYCPACLTLLEERGPR